MKGRLVIAGFTLYLDAVLVGLAIREPHLFRRSPWLFQIAVPVFLAVACVMFALRPSRPRSGLIPALVLGTVVGLAAAAGMWFWIAHAR